MQVAAAGLQASMARASLFGTRASSSVMSPAAMPASGGRTWFVDEASAFLGRWQAMQRARGAMMKWSERIAAYLVRQKIPLKLDIATVLGTR